MAYESPLWLEDVDVSAKMMRQLPSALFADQGVLQAGIPGGNAGAAAPGAGMTVTIQPFFGIVNGTTSAGQGRYLVQNSSAASVTVPAAPGTGQSRLDLIVAQIHDDDEDGGGVNSWELLTIEGTPAASNPALPTVPNNALAMYQIATTGTQTTLTTANITDLRVSALGWNEVPGEIKIWPHQPSAPMGWHYCDGSAVSRTAFPRLWTTMGTGFGPGDGSTTFNLPDFRGRVPVGMGTATASTSARTLAQTLGEEAHILTVTELPAHNHGNTGVENQAHNHNSPDSGLPILSDSGGNLAVPLNSAGLGGNRASVAGVTTTGAENQQHVHATNNAGGTAAHNNMQPSLVVGFIIRMA